MIVKTSTTCSKHNIENKRLHKEQIVIRDRCTGPHIHTLFGARTVHANDVVLCGQVKKTIELAATDTTPVGIRAMRLLNGRSKAEYDHDRFQCVAQYNLSKCNNGIHILMTNSNPEEFGGGVCWRGWGRGWGWGWG